MYLIDASYFVRELSIPNIDETYSENKKNLEYFIQDKVRLLLQNLLGYELFKDFESYLVNGALPSTGVPLKWTNLVYGAEYSIASKTYKWNGLIYTLGTYKKSLLAKYVYCEFLKEEQNTMTGVGMKVVEAKNSINYTSNYKLNNVWNQFIKEYQGGSNYLDKPYIGKKNSTTFIDWLGGENNNGYVSLVRFVMDNKDDYPNAPVYRYRIENSFGL